MPHSPFYLSPRSRYYTQNRRALFRSYSDSGEGGEDNTTNDLFHSALLYTWLSSLYLINEYLFCCRFFLPATPVYSSHTLGYRSMGAGSVKPCSKSGSNDISTTWVATNTLGNCLSNNCSSSFLSCLVNLECNRTVPFTLSFYTLYAGWAVSTWLQATRVYSVLLDSLSGLCYPWYYPL